MENNNQPEISQAISEEKSYYESTYFESDEAMKAFYLQMAININISQQIGENPEYIALKRLQHKLKQQARAVQPLCEYEWGRGISEIHEACGVYMMQKGIDPNKLIKANEEVGKHLQFMSKLAGNTGIIRQILGSLVFHINNVDYLMRRLKTQFEKAEALTE